ncbi:hypothetical protein EZS27_040325, partial [termite gut metagenome]
MIFSKNCYLRTKVGNTPNMVFYDLNACAI